MILDVYFLWFTAPRDRRISNDYTYKLRDIRHYPPKSSPIITLAVESGTSVVE